MITIWQRLVCSLMYILPWADALPYGNNLYYNFPISKLLIFPAIPIIFIKNSLPLGSLLLFLFLFLGIARNQQLPYFIRFNTMQALLINLILIIFNYLTILFTLVLGNLQILETLELMIFLATLSTIIFACIQSLRGLEADLPGISNSAKMQI